MNEYFSPKGTMKGFIMPKTILRMPNLSLGAKLLYAALVNCAYNGKEYCFPSQAYLADSLCVTIRTIQRYITELEKADLITPKVKRAGTVLRYYFRRHEVVQSKIGPVATHKERYDKMSQGYDKMSPVIINNKYNTNTPLPPKQQKLVFQYPATKCGDISSAFEKIWSLWPRKQDRKNSFSIWQRLFQEEKLPKTDALIAKIEQLTKLDRAWQRGAVTSLGKWLEGERWNDEPINILVNSIPSPAPYQKQEEYTAADMENGLKLLADMRQRARAETKTLLAENQRHTSETLETNHIKWRPINAQI